MAKGEAANLVTIESEASSQKPQSNPFFSFISQFVKPQEGNKAQENKAEIGNIQESVKRVDGEVNNAKPDVVRFQKTEPEVAPIKIESDEAEKDTNPIVLWQVYALGGFIVLRWVWAKWQERKEKSKKDSSGDENSPANENPPADENPPAED